MRRRPHRRSAAFRIEVTAALLLSAGCQSDQTNALDLTPSPSPSTSTSGTGPTVTPTPAALSEEEAILEQYRKFFALQTPLIEAPAAQRPAMLADVAVEPSYSLVLQNIAKTDAAKETFYGEVQLNPVVLSVNSSTARLRDCQDASGRGRMNRETGTKVTVGRAGDELLATMLRGDDGVWRMSEAVYQSGQC